MKLLLLLVAMCAAASTAFAQDKGCALVVMHGKWGNARYISYFGDKLEPTCAYKSIEMPWSARRSYDQPYPVALAEIAAQVKAFRQQGYQRVLLVGHSFGVNAALAYMAEVGDADGVIALAAGHSPESSYRRGIGRAEVDQARELVAAGKGDETLTMDDLNQGQRRSMRMSATTLLSYFDPQGLGHMPATAARFKKAVPIFYAVGTADPLYPLGPDFIYNRAPAHPYSKYLVLQADHGSTPEAAAADALAWVKGLP